MRKLKNFPPAAIKSKLHSESRNSLVPSRQRTLIAYVPYNTHNLLARTYWMMRKKFEIQFQNRDILTYEEGSKENAGNNLIILYRPLARLDIFNFLTKFHDNFTINNASYWNEFSRIRESTPCNSLVPFSGSSRDILPSGSQPCQSSSDCWNVNNLNYDVVDLEEKEEGDVYTYASKFASSLKEILEETEGFQSVSSKEDKNIEISRKTRSCPAVVEIREFSTKYSQRGKESKVLLLSCRNFEKFEKTFTKLLAKDKLRTVEPLLRNLSNRDQVLTKLERALVNHNIRMKNKENNKIKKNVIMMQSKLIQNIQSDLTKDTEEKTSSICNLKEINSKIIERKMKPSNIMIVNDQIFERQKENKLEKNNSYLNEKQCKMIYLNNAIFKELKKENVNKILNRKYTSYNDGKPEASIGIPTRGASKKLTSTNSARDKTEEYIEIPIENLIAAVAQKKHLEYVQRSRLSWKVFRQCEETLEKAEILNFPPFQNEIENQEKMKKEVEKPNLHCTDFPSTRNLQNETNQSANKIKRIDQKQEKKEASDITKNQLHIRSDTKRAQQVYTKKDVHLNSTPKKERNSENSPQRKKSITEKKVLKMKDKKEIKTIYKNKVETKIPKLKKIEVKSNTTSVIKSAKKVTANLMKKQTNSEKIESKRNPFPHTIKPRKNTMEKQEKVIDTKIKTLTNSPKIYEKVELKSLLQIARNPSKKIIPPKKSKEEFINIKKKNKLSFQEQKHWSFEEEDSPPMEVLHKNMIRSPLSSSQSEFITDLIDKPKKKVKKSSSSLGKLHRKTKDSHSKDFADETETKLIVEELLESSNPSKQNKKSKLPEKKVRSKLPILGTPTTIRKQIEKVAAMALTTINIREKFNKEEDIEEMSKLRREKTGTRKKIKVKKVESIESDMEDSKENIKEELKSGKTTSDKTRLETIKTEKITDSKIQIISQIQRIDTEDKRLQIDEILAMTSNSILSKINEKLSRKIENDKEKIKEIGAKSGTNSIETNTSNTQEDNDEDNSKMDKMNENLELRMGNPYSQNTKNDNEKIKESDSREYLEGEEISERTEENLKNNSSKSRIERENTENKPTVNEETENKIESKFSAVEQEEKNNGGPIMEIILEEDKKHDNNTDDLKTKIINREEENDSKETEIGKNILKAKLDYFTGSTNQNPDISDNIKQEQFSKLKDTNEDIKQIVESRGISKMKNKESSESEKITPTDNEIIRRKRLIYFKDKMKNNTPTKIENEIINSKPLEEFPNKEIKSDETNNLSQSQPSKENSSETGIHKKVQAFSEGKKTSSSQYISQPNTESIEKAIETVSDNKNVAFTKKKKNEPCERMTVEKHRILENSISDNVRQPNIEAIEKVTETESDNNNLAITKENKKKPCEIMAIKNHRVSGNSISDNVREPNIEGIEKAIEAKNDRDVAIAVKNESDNVIRPITEGNEKAIETESDKDVVKKESGAETMTGGNHRDSASQNVSQPITEGAIEAKNDRKNMAIAVKKENGPETMTVGNHRDSVSKNVSQLITECREEAIETKSDRKNMANVVEKENGSESMTVDNHRDSVSRNVSQLITECIEEAIETKIDKKNMTTAVKNKSESMTTENHRILRNSLSDNVIVIKAARKDSSKRLDQIENNAKSFLKQAHSAVKYVMEIPKNHREIAVKLRKSQEKIHNSIHKIFQEFEKLKKRLSQTKMTQKRSKEIISKFNNVISKKTIDSDNRLEFKETKRGSFKPEKNVRSVIEHKVTSKMKMFKKPAVKLKPRKKNVNHLNAKMKTEMVNSDFKEEGIKTDFSPCISISDIQNRSIGSLFADTVATALAKCGEVEKIMNKYSNDKTKNDATTGTEKFEDCTREEKKKLIEKQDEFLMDEQVRKLVFHVTLEKNKNPEVGDEWKCCSKAVLVKESKEKLTKNNEFPSSFLDGHQENQENLSGTEISIQNNEETKRNLHEEKKKEADQNILSTNTDETKITENNDTNSKQIKEDGCVAKSSEDLDKETEKKEANVENITKCFEQQKEDKDNKFLEQKHSLHDTTKEEFKKKEDIPKCLLSIDEEQTEETCPEIFVTPRSSNSNITSISDLVELKQDGMLKVSSVFTEETRKKSSTSTIELHSNDGKQNLTRKEKIELSCRLNNHPKSLICRERKKDAVNTVLRRCEALEQTVQNVLNDGNTTEDLKEVFVDLERMGNCILNSVYCKEKTTNEEYVGPKFSTLKNPTRNFTTKNTFEGYSRFKEWKTGDPKKKKENEDDLEDIREEALENEVFFGGDKKMRSPGRNFGKKRSIYHEIIKMNELNEIDKKNSGKIGNNEDKVEIKDEDSTEMIHDNKTLMQKIDMKKMKSASEETSFRDHKTNEVFFEVKTEENTEEKDKIEENLLVTSEASDEFELSKKTGEEDIKNKAENEIILDEQIGKGKKRTLNEIKRHKILEKFSMISQDPDDSIFKISETLKFDRKNKKMCETKNTISKPKKIRPKTQKEENFNVEKPRMTLRLTPTKELYTPPPTAQKSNTNNDLKNLLVQNPKKLMKIASAIMTKNQYLSFLLDLRSTKELKEYWMNKIKEGFTSTKHFGDLKKILDKVRNVEEDQKNEEVKQKKTRKQVDVSEEIEDFRLPISKPDIKSTKSEVNLMEERKKIEREEETKRPKTGPSSLNTKQKTILNKENRPDKSSSRNLSSQQEHCLHSSGYTNLPYTLAKYLESPIQKNQKNESLTRISFEETSDDTEIEKVKNEERNDEENAKKVRSEGDSTIEDESEKKCFEEYEIEKIEESEIRQNKDVPEENKLEEIDEDYNDKKAQQTAIVLPGREPMKISLISDEISCSPVSSVKDKTEKNALENLSDVLSNCSGPVSSLCSKEISRKKRPGFKRTHKGEILQQNNTSTTNSSESLRKCKHRMPESSKKSENPPKKHARDHRETYPSKMTDPLSNTENFDVNQNVERKIRVVKTKSLSEVLKEDPNLLKKLRNRTMVDVNREQTTEGARRFEYRFHDFRRKEDKCLELKARKQEEHKKDLLNKFKCLIQARKVATERNRQTIRTHENQQIQPKVFSKILDRINYFKDLENHVYFEKQVGTGETHQIPAKRGGTPKSTKSNYGNQKMLSTKKKQINEDELVTWVQEHPAVPVQRVVVERMEKGDIEKQNVIHIPWTPTCEVDAKN